MRNGEPNRNILCNGSEWWWCVGRGCGGSVDAGEQQRPRPRLETLTVALGTHVAVETAEVQGQHGLRPGHTGHRQDQGYQQTQLETSADHAVASAVRGHATLPVS